MYKAKTFNFLYQELEDCNRSLKQLEDNLRERKMASPQTTLKAMRNWQLKQGRILIAIARCQAHQHWHFNKPS